MSLTNENTNSYKFEEYTLAGGRFTPLISLGKVGGFGISAGFSKKYDLSRVIGVKLFYDSEKRAVGFRFLVEKASGMLKFKLHRQGGGYINAKPFLIKFDIDPVKYHRKYLPKEVEVSGQGKLFVIELQEKTKAAS